MKSLKKEEVFRLMIEDIKIKRRRVSEIVDSID
mgnify:CR=1 FL=1